MKLPVVAADKGTHFIAGNIVAVLAKLVFPELLAAGLIAAVVAGVAKEAVDYVLGARQKKAGVPVTHSADPMDAVYTAAGGLSTLF